jgi:hypothetical protein
MTDLRLDLTDATELAETLQLITDWLNHDPDRLNTSLTQFIGHPAYNTSHLAHDLHRFTFLLGGNDGETLFTTDQT